MLFKTLKCGLRCYFHRYIKEQSPSIYLLLDHQLDGWMLIVSLWTLIWLLTCYGELNLLNVCKFQSSHTNTDGHHGSTTAPIAVGCHNTDGVYHIVGYSDWNTSSAGGDWTEAWTDSDGVVDWSPTIKLWGLPLHCEDHTVLAILLNSVGGSLRRRGETCGGERV